MGACLIPAELYARSRLSVYTNVFIVGSGNKRIYDMFACLLQVGKDIFLQVVPTSVQRSLCSSRGDCPRVRQPKSLKGRSTSYFLPKAEPLDSRLLIPNASQERVNGEYCLAFRGNECCFYQKIGDESWRQPRARTSLL